MAIWNIATDLQTKQTIWVSTNVVRGRKQLNSHNSDCYNRAQIDGYTAAELADLHTEYVGNGWQSKYVEFVEKWGEPE